MQRKKENFRCRNCGEWVVGNGYTDHCFKCLWGRHRDELVPGDRASACGGMMKPLRVWFKAGKYRIDYKCNDCGHRFVVDAAKKDDREKLLEMLR